MSQIDSPERLSRKQKRVIHRTFSAIAPRHDLVARLTFERLRELGPSLSAACTQNDEEGRRRLMHLLALLVQRIDDRVALCDACLTQARRTGCDPFEGGASELFAEAFVGALRSVLGGRCTSDVEVAWRSFFHVIEQAMSSGIFPSD